MIISVDARSPVPLFEQVRAQIAVAIESGEVLPGQRLPTVRQLAADLRIAVNTVARAYHPAPRLSHLADLALSEALRRRLNRFLRARLTDREWAAVATSAGAFAWHRSAAHRNWRRAWPAAPSRMAPVD